ncbi:MAG TPA: dTDP-glucose 4,6-dehydratase [Vicinamibacterales bacterium]|nr:dTDP-glucose 4,6-dehydratase [Vicinamibacterales bacterium]
MDSLVTSGAADTMVHVLVTGGAGFIGSNFVRYALTQHPDWHVTTLDKLTYAGRRENLHDVMQHPRHTFVHDDICNAAVSGPLVEASNLVVHFAAETHVDRSIMAAGDFIRTDVEGTFVLLEAARRARGLRRFVQISTDEVYGSVTEGASRETDELKPRNPYSASKAGADRLAYSYFATYNLPVVITRASNNYGPYQFPEKVLPLFVTNLVDDIPVPLYGDGLNVRDWLYVTDHCRALDLVIEHGVNGEVYNVGGGNEVRNVDLTHRILQALEKPRSLITPVPDRPGHDRRYALDTSKLRQLGWKPEMPFEQGLRATIDWYRENEWWWRPIKERDPAFRAYYEAQYGPRS